MRRIFAQLKSTRLQRTKAKQIYGGVVAQARAPAFYGRNGVPDTMNGRYELVVLHMFFLMERLRQATTVDAELLRVLVETFVEDMDDCMRELGVGDLKVGGHVKRATAGLYERAAVYREAIEFSGVNGDGIGAGTSHLQNAFVAHGLLLQDNGLALKELADYVRATIEKLDSLPDQEVVSGNVSRLFAEPPPLNSPDEA